MKIKQVTEAQAKGTSKVRKNSVQTDAEKPTVRFNLLLRAYPDRQALVDLIGKHATWASFLRSEGISQYDVTSLRNHYDIGDDALQRPPTNLRNKRTAAVDIDALTERLWDGIKGRLDDVIEHAIEEYLASEYGSILTKQEIDYRINHIITERKIASPGNQYQARTMVERFVTDILSEGPDDDEDEDEDEPSPFSWLNQLIDKRLNERLGK